MKVWIAIACADHTGLIAAIAGCLFDFGASLGTTNFAVLGEAAEFTAVCELGPGIAVASVRERLSGLDLLRQAEITVRPFTLGAERGPEGRITHEIAVSGGDRPGLVARLCEAFAGFGANVVRLDAEPVAGPGGDIYVARFAVSIPPERAKACLATISNTAEGLGLACRVTGPAGGA